MVDRFVNSPTWEECRQMVISNLELLSDDADSLLLANLRQYPADSREYKGLYKSRSVLKKSRETGTDSAFADRIIPSELKEILQQLRKPASGGENRLRIELARKGLNMTSETLRPRMRASFWEYLKTFRLSAAQPCRAYLLSHLAENGWNLEAAARALKQSKRELVIRLDKAGFGYTLKDEVLQQARKRKR